jgi:ribosome biogenesis GTPase A
LLPKSLKEGKLNLWIRHQAKLLGLKVKDLVLISVHKKHHIDELVSLIDRYRGKRNVYVIGSTNVGKSSLINQMLRSEGMLDYDLITTSVIPATTLNLIEIPFFESGKAGRMLFRPAAGVIIRGRNRSRIRRIHNRIHRLQ